MSVVQITTPEEDRRDIESLYHKMTAGDLTTNLTKVSLNNYPTLLLVVG